MKQTISREFNDSYQPWWQSPNGRRRKCECRKLAMNYENVEQKSNENLMNFCKVCSKNESTLHWSTIIVSAIDIEIILNTNRISTTTTEAASTIWNDVWENWIENRRWKFSKTTNRIVTLCSTQVFASIRMIIRRKFSPTMNIRKIYPSDRVRLEGIWTKFKFESFPYFFCSEKIPFFFKKQASNVVPTKIDNIRPSSTTNETIDEFLDQTFQDQDETDEKSHEEISGGSERTFNEAKKIVSVREDFQLVRPVALRPDGTKADSVPSSTREITKPWQSSAFPRSLTSRKTLPVNNSKRQLPSVPIVEPKITTPIEQFQSEQVFQLLDNLSSNDEEKSSKTFFSLLDQMKTIHVEPNCSSFSFTESNPVEQFSFNEKLRISAEKLFQHSICSGAERFYRTFVVSLNDSTNLPLYEMTVSTVQFSSTIQLPYSILDGRRPLIKYSNRTNFKPIQSKRNTWTCHVTALESPLETNSLKQNDIILQVKKTRTNERNFTVYLLTNLSFCFQVNGESVLDLEIEQIIQLIKQFRRRSSELSLTVARLCQPSFHRDFV